MKTKKEKRSAFAKEMKKLKKEGSVKEDSLSFLNLLKKAIKPQSSSR